jgi:hypothetical protein
MNSTATCASTASGRPTAGKSPAVVCGPRESTGRCAYSNWRLSAGGKSINPAYTGTVRVDPETGKTLSAELIARGLPDSFPWDLAELRVTYDWVKIEGTTYLLPVRSENVCCVRETWTCTRNVIVFRHHRKFGAQSKLTFH